MEKRTPLGIRILQIIMIVFAAALLAFIGWRVVSYLTTPPETPPSSVDQNSQTPEPSDTTATYSSDVIGVTFEYPKGWKKVECPDRPTAVYFGTDDRGVGIEDGKSIICGLGNDFPPQMSFALNEAGDYQGEAPAVDVTIDGIQAKKYREISQEPGLYPEGFETVTYYIPLTGKMLIASYQKWPSDYSESYDTSEESMKQFESLVESDLNVHD